MARSMAVRLERLAARRGERVICVAGGAPWPGRRLQAAEAEAVRTGAVVRVLARPEPLDWNALLRALE